MRLLPERTPVIVGVGEIADRPDDTAPAMEPIALMHAALRLAAQDAGADLLGEIDSIDIVNEISWPYRDAVGLLTHRLGIAPRHARYGVVGGQTPIEFIAEAAVRIAAGEARVAAICGAEAECSIREAARAGHLPAWSARDEHYRPLRGADYQRDIARQVEASSPVHVYPFYENATRAAWGQSFAEAQAESSLIWATNADVARDRPAAWIRRVVRPEDIARPTAENRRIAWPYTKLMVANPIVNQGAAVILTTLEYARMLGIAEDRLIHIWGTAAADEARDILERPDYVHSRAQAFVLDAAYGLLPQGAAFDHIELYSCFPVVPKMARRHLGVPADRALTVAGGLTFFGAPLNNYMTHATVAMVERLRASPGTAGLLYGQGEYVTKHRTLVLSTSPFGSAIVANDGRGAIATGFPEVDERYRGPAALETFTVLFDRAGAVRHGIVIVRAPDGRRTMAAVPGIHTPSIELLLSETRPVIGALGQVIGEGNAAPEWRIG